MKLVIVSEYCRPWPGGISEHVFFEAEQLSARGHQVTVISGPGSSGAGFSPAVNVIELGRELLFPSNGSTSRMCWDARLLRLDRLLRALDPNVIHVHAPLDPVLPLGAVLVSPVPVVGTFHASFEPSALWRLVYGPVSPWARRASRKLVRSIAVSAEAERCIARYRPGHYVRIPNGVDTERFHPQRPVPSELRSRRPVILFIGRPDLRKGLGLLLDAFAITIARGLDAELRIVGPVLDDTRTMLLTRLPENERSRVRFYGYVSADALPTHLNAATVLCAPSIAAESQGIVLLEAFASGVPVVTFDIPGYREVVEHRVNGLMAQTGSVLALADALQALCVDVALRDRLGRQARQSALAYAWQNVAVRIETCLLEALASDRPADG